MRDVVELRLNYSGDLLKDYYKVVIPFFAFFFCLLAIRSAKAQFSGFGRQQLLGKNEVSNPIKTLSADVNGDGYTDLIVLSHDRIGWYENNKDGTFGSRNSIAYDSVHLFNADAAVSDVNKDGKLDIITVSQYSNDIVVYLNDGNGNFTPEILPYTIDMGSDKKYVDLGDLNGDNAPEIIIYAEDENNNPIYLLTNKGDGHYNPPTSLIANITAPLIGPVIITDFNNDGFKDLIANNGKIILFLNDGNGQMKAPVSVGQVDNQSVFPNHIPPVCTMDVSDLNDDGYKDLITSHVFQNSESKYESTVVFLKNDSKLVLDPSIAITDTLAFRKKEGLYTYLNTSLQFNVVKSADFNKDGNTDIVASAYGSDFICWYENKGNGASWVKHTIDTAVGGPKDISLADIDHNGYTDVIVTLFNRDQIVYYLNNGDDTFSSPKIVDEASNSAVTEVSSADMDGDGDNDVVTVIHNHNLIWYKNDGSGKFDGPIEICKTSDSFTSLKLVDINGDQKPDILFYGKWLKIQGDSTRYFGTIGWVLNEGNGTFTSPQIIRLNEAVYDVQLADINGDGRKDIVSLQNTIKWYANEGNGHWGSPVPIVSDPNLDPIMNVFLAYDLDGNGAADLLYTTLVQNPNSTGRPIQKIHILKNDGHGSLTAVSGILTKYYLLSAIKACDIDQDKRADIIVIPHKGDPSLNPISWYQNMGSLSFELYGNIGTHKYYDDTYIADLDKDGYPDLLCSYDSLTGNSITDYKLSWYYNQGNGTFDSNRIITDKINLPTAVSAADLDGDRSPDALFASPNEDKLGWYRNTGNNSGHGTSVVDANSILPKKFALHQNYPNPFNPATTIAYDLPKTEHVVLRVYNVLGRLIYTLVNKDQAAGHYTIHLNASTLSSGLYFYRMRAGSFVVTKKLMLIK